MTDTSSVEPACASCAVTPPGFFERYRGFLLSPGTLITAANALLLLAGFVATLAGRPQLGSWLYLASALIGGAPIFKLAAGNILRSFDLTAGVMVSIAMIAAIIIGEYSAAALVAFMMLVGEMLENLTMARADNALKELASLVPDTVTLRRDGQDVEVPIQAVRPGDVVLVRPGGRIPVDGRVRSGNAAVDQAAITGESMPLDKGPGDGVFAGTLATGGALEIEIDKVGRETTLGYMLRLVEEVRSTHAPVQRVANRYAQYLTPLALAISAVTYLFTGDITRSITVLVVICPCALVLATPTAIVAAIGNAARRGILAKHGTAMEQIGRVDVVAFDKTGTLTLGEPHLGEVVSLNGFDNRELLALAASAERSSEHPLARAIVAAARGDGLEPVAPSGLRSVPGYGIQAQVEGQDVIIGERMLALASVPLDSFVEARMRELAADGATVIPVAVDRTVAGILVVADTVRPESKAAVERLKRLGVKETVLISGDQDLVAAKVGQALGVDRVHSQVLPQDKLALIRDIQAKGLRVAFVGDGVNDAPALAAADVGIAMGAIGTAVAMETADVVLLTDAIERVPELIDLSRACLGTIRNNVIFSMIMNVLAVVLSVFGLIGPVVGAAMHELSALPVVANSARLIGRKPRDTSASAG
jgi:heavy metal translocating P-type ATPase